MCVHLYTERKTSGWNFAAVQFNKQVVECERETADKLNHYFIHSVKNVSEMIPATECNVYWR